MRKYGYKRPRATLYTRRRTRNKRPSFFFRFFCILLLLLGIGWGGFAGLRYGWHLLKNAQINNWHVRSVALSGLQGSVEKDIFTQASALQGKPFSFEDSEKLRQEITRKYPMLKRVSVVRGLLTGKLKISAKYREPVARLVLPDQSAKYIDEDNVIYADPSNTVPVADVELLGTVPQQLESNFVELVQSALKLKKSLPFEKLQFDLRDNTVQMCLPDQSIVRFGQPVHLKAKVRRAAQIMNKARVQYDRPVTLNFEFFEYGKVFLTLSSH